MVRMVLGYVHYRKQSPPSEPGPATAIGIFATAIGVKGGGSYNDLELSLTITIPLLMFTRNRMIKKVLPSSIIASPLCGGGLGVLPRARGRCAL